MVNQTTAPLSSTRPIGMPNWQCSKCGKKFQTKGQAKYHEMMVHSNG